MQNDENVTLGGMAQKAMRFDEIAEAVLHAGLDELAALRKEATTLLMSMGCDAELLEDTSLRRAILVQLCGFDRRMDLLVSSRVAALGVS